jgi:hypothetical protein
LLPQWVDHHFLAGSAPAGALVETRGPRIVSEDVQDGVAISLLVDPGAGRASNEKPCGMS